MNKLCDILLVVAGIVFAILFVRKMMVKSNGAAEDAGELVRTYSIELNDTLLHFFSVEVTYPATDCQLRSEVIDTAVWYYESDTWCDASDMGLCIRLRDGVDTNHESAAYIRGKYLDLRLIAQGNIVKRDGSKIFKHHFEKRTGSPVNLENTSFLSLQNSLSVQRTSDVINGLR